MRPLPATRYSYGAWKIGVKVNIDYHIEADRHYYSVPYQLVGQRVDVRTSAVAVEVFHSVGASPPTCVLGPGPTHHRPAHMPDSHRRHAQWTPSRIIAWAEQTGPNTAALAQEIMAARPHPEQGYRSCLGIIRLGERYGTERLEAACARALAARALSYRSVESILSHGLDSQPLGRDRRPERTAAITTCVAPSTTDEGRQPALLTNTTLDDLHTLKLPGMARGLLEQREHADYDALAFEERLGMLVDRELTERPNRRLERLLKAAHLRLSATVEGIDFARPRGLERAQVLSLAESHWVDRTTRRHRGRHRAGQDLHILRSGQRRGPAWSLRPLPARARLHDEIALARADGRLPRLMAAWARTDVLLIDDFLLRPLGPDQAADLLEVIEDRVGIRATIVTSQLPVVMWHEALGEPTIADGILDRLLENVHRIELHGESLRRRSGTDEAAASSKKARTPTSNEK